MSTREVKESLRTGTANHAMSFQDELDAALGPLSYPAKHILRRNKTASGGSSGTYTTDRNYASPTKSVSIPIVDSTAPIYSTEL